MSTPAKREGDATTRWAGGTADLSGRAVLARDHHPRLWEQPRSHHQASFTHPGMFIHTHLLRQMTRLSSSFTVFLYSILTDLPSREPRILGSQKWLRLVCVRQGRSCTSVTAFCLCRVWLRWNRMVRGDCQWPSLGQAWEAAWGRMLG